MVIKSNDSIIIEEQAFPADDSYGIAAGSRELDFVPGPDLQSEQAEVRSEEVIRAAELSYRRLVRHQWTTLRHIVSTEFCQRTTNADVSE